LGSSSGSALRPPALTGLTSAVHDAHFERLVRDHHRAVHTYARSMASTPTIAEDAVQNTFLRAWKYLDSFRGNGSFEGWLIRICRRCIIDLENRQRRDTELAAPQAHQLHAHPPDNRAETLALIGDLPREQREVVVICGILGYDYDSAATILDIPVGTVRSRLHRGRAALAEALRAEPSDEATA
jgi:RNA polymerase sigma-70 factor, ECF subfamily